MRDECADAELITGWKWTERRQLGGDEIDRYRPLVIGRLPFRRRFGLDSQRPQRFGVIREKRLQEHLVDVAAGRVASERPDLIPQRSERPWPGLLEDHDAGAHRPFPTTERRFARRGEADRRTDAPNEHALGR